jgi:hypothetical protein
MVVLAKRVNSVVTITSQHRHLPRHAPLLHLTPNDLCFLCRGLITSCGGPVDVEVSLPDPIAEVGEDRMLHYVQNLKEDIR